MIGGGDTGNDCIGTCVRHGAASVVNFELLERPEENRKADNPWPEWPRIMRVDYGHQEVMAVNKVKDPRTFSIRTTEFLDDGSGNVKGLRTIDLEWATDAQGRMFPKDKPGTEREWPCDFVFLAMGFLGPEATAISKLGLELDARSNVKADFGKFATSVPGVFAAGDCRRGQSLVVWAIAEGRQAAREIDRFLMGETRLP